MKITIYDNPSVFLEIITQNFSKPDGENELMLGLTNTLVKDPDHYGCKAFLSTVTLQNKFKLCAFMTPPWNIIIYGNDPVDPIILTGFAEFLINNDISIPGVNSKINISKLFAEIYCRKKKCQYKEKMNMTFNILKSVKKISYSAGDLITAEGKHKDLVLDWTYKFNEEAKLGMPENAIERHVDFIINGGYAYLWFEEKICSMAFMERPSEKGVGIAYVYTPMDLRNRGYGTSCVASLCKKALERDYKYCCLFADKTNPISNRLYQKVGFTPLCDYVMYDFF